MPSRQRTRQITGGPQGDDAFILVRYLTVGDSKALYAEGDALRKRAEASDDPELVKALNEKANEMLAEFVMDWNWVDDDDKPLPKPKGKPAVFDLLLTNEIQWLTQAAIGGLDDEKKST